MRATRATRPTRPTRMKPAVARNARLKPAAARRGPNQAMTALVAAEKAAYFGPLFFMQHLRGLVRERCPAPADGLPSVQIHLMDGEALDVCHIIGIAPGWIALAVHELEMPDRPSQLRTELVPYPLIARVSIQTTRHEGAHPIGFNAASEPAVYGSIPAAEGMTPEEALRALAGPPVTAAAPAAPRRRQSEQPTSSGRRPR